MSSKPLYLAAAAMATLGLSGAAEAASVTPDVIFGSGVTNGNFTVVSTAGGIELGLRAKLRHNEAGAPENTFNWDGVDTYTFSPGVAPGQSFPTAEWSFEWSINTDAHGLSGRNLDDLTYQLSMTGPSNISPFDPIHDVNPGLGRTQWDHAIGDNSTSNGAGQVISNGDDDEPGYLALISDNNVAQNSWKPHWFSPGFDPTTPGDYDFTLTALYDGDTITSTSMTVTVVPLPAAGWAGMALLGAMGGVAGVRRKFGRKGSDD